MFRSKRGSVLKELVIPLLHLPIQWSSSTHPAGSKTLPSLPSGHPPPLLATNLTPFCPAVILHPCWRPTSPLPTQRSSSTYPAGGQTLPSPPSAHPPPLLAANLTPPHPAVIFHPFWWPTSPLPPETRDEGMKDERRDMRDKR